MATLALLLTALLFGGMSLFSFGFAAVLFKIFDAPTARAGIRGAFPFYYLWVIAAAALAGLCTIFQDALTSLLLIAIALSTIYARQSLMEQINAATDSEDKARFSRLHGVSVVLQLVQIGLAAWALVRLG